MQAQASAYASYHDLLRPDVPAAVFGYAKPDVSSYASFDPKSEPGILPAYLAADGSDKKDAYAAWDPSAPVAASPYEAVIDKYASTADFIAYPAASAYSQPSTDRPAATEPAVAPAPEVPPPPRIKKERPIAKYRDWNEEFQQGLEAWDKGNTREEATRHIQSLQKLVTEFTSEAHAIATVIISELALPLERKTIRPIDAGGIAGGIKFLVKDIFFKVACDEMGLYGDDQYAQKAALLEFSGLLSLLHVRLSTKVKHFHLPLMCILSLRGRTLTASSVLPIEANETLVYGSRDAGKTVLASDPVVNKMAQEIAAHLNLKGHWCGTTPDQMKYLHLPVDIEVHRGLDGRVYIIDTARIFPPVTIDKRRRASHLYRLMRSEFVRSHYKPLSSDAFSRMAIHATSAENNAEVKEATSRLHERVIPEAVQRISSKLDLSNYNVSTAKRFVMLLHQHGVNFRLLGASNNAAFRLFALHEMVARGLKNLYFAHLRSAPPVDDESLRKCTAAFLNDAFADDEAATTFWREKLLPKLQVDFDLSPEEEAPAIRASLDLDGVFSRLQSLVSCTVTHPMTVSNMADYVTGRPFTASDVESVEMRVKWLYIFAVWDAYTLVGQAEQREGDEAERLRLQAAAKYRSALSVFPGNSHALSSYGMALMLVADVASNRGDSKSAQAFLAMACDQYECAMFAGDHLEDHRILRYWALALKNSAQMCSDQEQKWRLFKEADDKATAATAACHNVKSPSELYETLDNHALVLFRYAEHLCMAGRTEEAKPLWKRAYDKFTEAINAWRAHSGAAYLNHALALETNAKYAGPTEQAELLRLAEDTYVRGEKVDMPDADLAGFYYVWGTFHLTGRHVTPPEGETLAESLDMAIEKFSKSVSKRDVFHKAWHAWGMTLRRKAALVPKAERTPILEDALAKVRSALKAFPSFTLAKMEEAEILLDLALLAPQANNTERYRRALIIGEEVVARDPHIVRAWGLVGNAAFRLSEPTRDQSLLRRAAEAYRKQFQLATGMPESFTWRDGLESPDPAVRSGTLQVLLRITTNPEEQITATREGCVDAIIASADHFLHTPSIRLSAANVVWNCSCSPEARRTLRSNEAIAKALVRALMHTGTAPVPPEELIPWTHCVYGALATLAASYAPFGAACIPAASADNETERVAITTRMFTDLETVLAEGGAVEGEFICELLEHIAKSASPIQLVADGHQDAVIFANYLASLYRVWFVNAGGVRIAWAVGPLVRQSGEFFPIVAQDVIGVLRDPKSSGSVQQISLRLLSELLAADTPDAHIRWFVTKAGGSEALATGMANVPSVAIQVISGLVKRGVGLSDLRSGGVDCALLYHSKLASSPVRDPAGVLLEALVAATATDGASETLSRKLFTALSSGRCTLSVTGATPAMQLYFSCKTCHFAPGTCACATCAMACHAGHELGPAQYDMAYCDCPAELNEHCVASRSHQP